MIVRFKLHMSIILIDSVLDGLILVAFRQVMMGGGLYNSGRGGPNVK